jgi:hypothetical protein
MWLEPSYGFLERCVTSGMNSSLYVQGEEKRREEERQRALSRRSPTRASDRQRSDAVRRRILVALQGREADEAMLNRVQAQVARMKALVAPLWVAAVSGDRGRSLERQWQLAAGSSSWRRKNHAKAYLPQLVLILEQAGLGVEAALVISTRSQADEIVAQAAEHSCNLVLMASDPQPWYVRWLEHSRAGTIAVV